MVTANMKRTTILIGAGIGVATFLLAHPWFMSLLAALGYVDSAPGSLLVSILFLGCMLVMCLGYGIGLAAWWSKRFHSRPGSR